MIRSTLTALALTLALIGGGAPADAQQRVSEQLILSVEQELPNYVQGVDVRSLSAGQVASLHHVLHSNRSPSRIRGQIIAILGGLDELLFGRNLATL
ncbi:hypothetical protein [Nioella ostreopsis]|uniref:hypothetical protein n=1 Tax=Nioella ostreopsis TaxID=2448479 RepID=UPI000FDBB2A1|nr:hypothetical protein [Nioella ostreopsis]